MKGKKRSFFTTFFSCFMVAALTTTAYSSAPAKKEEPKSAIVVAAFGTTVPEALVGITNIVDQIRKAYPHTEVRLCFTSNIIRKVWKKRQAEADKWLKMGIPEEVLYVKNIIAVLGDLREDGYNDIIVQPTHMFFMEQSYDLQQYVNAINSIETKKERWKPFHHVVMGRPALGAPGHKVNYHDDIKVAIKTLENDAKHAEKKQAALVYMGHGNEHWATSIFEEVAAEMNKAYPEVKTVIGVVEGEPTVEHVAKELKAAGVKKVVLKPFMIVAGDHAVNDMASDEEDSWKTVLSKEGFEVETVLEGLGEKKEFASIFVKHIAEVAEENHIKLN